jgi:hypothetical protein
MKFSSIILTLLPFASALCDDPITTSSSFLLSGAPQNLSITNFFDGTWLYPQSSVTVKPATRVLSTPYGFTNESLVVSTYSPANPSWILAWNKTTEESPFQLSDSAVLDYYVHYIAASPFCEGRYALLEWDSAACGTGAEELATYLGGLHKQAGEGLIKKYGGGWADESRVICANATSNTPLAPISSPSGGGGGGGGGRGYFTFSAPQSTHVVSVTPNNTSFRSVLAASRTDSPKPTLVSSSSGGGGTLPSQPSLQNHADKSDMLVTRPLGIVVGTGAMWLLLQ